MGRALRRHRGETRASERIPLCATLRLTTLDGRAVAPLARCTEIGLGGLRATAACGLPPGTRVIATVELASGRSFRMHGRVVWCRTTLHPALLGTPRGMDDDALFGVAFEEPSPDALLPVARLFVAREAERRRARVLRRRRGRVLHA